MHSGDSLHEEHEINEYTYRNTDIISLLVIDTEMRSWLVEMEGGNEKERMTTHLESERWRTSPQPAQDL